MQAAIIMPAIVRKCLAAKGNVKMKSDYIECYGAGEARGRTFARGGATMEQRIFLKKLKELWAAGPRGSKKPLVSIYHYGEFEGESCFVVGGGPSLQGFDFAPLENRYTIGLNKICKLFAPWLLYAADPGVIIPYFQEYGNPEKTHLVIGDIQNTKMNDVHYVRCQGFHGLPDNLDSIYTGMFSSYGAVNLAIALGFNPIYLLGFDYCIMEGKDHAFDDWGKPAGFVEHYLNRAKIEIESLAPLAAEAGIEIINLSPKSALTCFKFGSLKDAL